MKEAGRWRRRGVGGRSCLWLVAMVLLSGCLPRCQGPPPEGLDGAFELERFVPPEIPWVIYGETLESVLEALETVDQAAGPLPVQGPSTARYREAGAALWAPGVAYGNGQAIVVVAYRDPGAESPGLEALWSGDGSGLQDVDLGMRRSQGLRGRTADGRVLTAGQDRRHLMVTWPVGEAGVVDIRPLWSLGEEGQWSLDEEERSHYEALEPEAGGVVGVWRPGPVIRRLPGEGQVAALRDQIAAQAGRVYFRIHGDDGEATLELLTPGDTSLQAWVGDLGEAGGALPDMGGLVRPGILGVVRISMEPTLLRRLLEGALSVEDQEALARTLEGLREELQLDLEAAVEGHLLGQAAVVAFSFEDAFYDLRGMELIGALLRLQATREAVLLPVQDRPGLEDLLNVFMQMSQGRMRRQVTGHTVQYAWFDGGSLQWAMILSDSHLLFLDSSVGFDHALSWERNPRSLGDAMEARGVPGLLERDRGVGLFLDLGMIRTLLRGSAHEAAVPWLENLEALSLETDVEERADRARLRIWLKEARGEGGGDE